MKQFIITEEEKRYIKGLYEQVDPNAQAYNDAAEKELIRLYPDNEYLTKTAQEITKTLDYATKEGSDKYPKYQMNATLVPYIKKLIQTKSENKINFDKTSRVQPVTKTSTKTSTSTTTSTYYLGTDKNANFTVIGGKDIPGGKELTVNLTNIGFYLKKQNYLDGVDVSKLTGKLTYTSSNGLVKLTVILPTNTSPEMVKSINYAFDFMFNDIVTKGVSIDEKNFFHDDTLVARLKNIKTPTTPVGGVSQQPIAGEKINTTNDKLYDYKLSNGKYYYSKKGLNQWVEAKGAGLNNIKTKVKF